MKTYFVKSLFRTAASGAASNLDRNHDPSLTLVEERIVMFEAKDDRDALQQAAREARAYARDTHVNPYGQRVKTRFLGALSSYELFETLAPGEEVFSETEVVAAEVPDAELVDRRMGHAESAAERRRRINFCNREFYVRREAGAKRKRK